ncbi:hypothetical protein [Candidatus Competibacter phosphatis]|nr:hypothetical protein [Candidatus Competibacter phosphatis]
MLDYINKNNIHHIQYAGLDISQAFIDICKKKYSNISFF